MYSDNEFINNNVESINDDNELTNDNVEVKRVNDDNELANVETESKKTSLKMNAPSFIYDNKTITVTHNMVLHITIPGSINFQVIFYNSSPPDEQYFLELMNIIFTTLISKVPDNLTFKLFILQIPSYAVPHKFAIDAFDILKPLILNNPNTLHIYEKYFTDREWVEEIKHPFSSDDSTDEEK